MISKAIQVSQWKNKNRGEKRGKNTKNTNVLFLIFLQFLSQPQATADQCKKFTLLHKTSKTVTWAPENNGEKQEEEVVTQEVLEQRRMQKLEKAGIKVLPAVVRYNRSGRMGMRTPASAVVEKRFCLHALTWTSDGRNRCSGWTFGLVMLSACNCLAALRRMFVW